MAWNVGGLLCFVECIKNLKGLSCSTPIKTKIPLGSACKAIKISTNNAVKEFVISRNLSFLS